jgi:hypothetical protein
MRGGVPWRHAGAWPPEAELPDSSTARPGLRLHGDATQRTFHPHTKAIGSSQAAHPCSCIGLDHSAQAEAADLRIASRCPGRASGALRAAPFERRPDRVLRSAEARGGPSWGRSEPPAGATQPPLCARARTMNGTSIEKSCGEPTGSSPQSQVASDQPSPRLASRSIPCAEDGCREIGWPVVRRDGAVRRAVTARPCAIDPAGVMIAAVLVLQWAI